MAATTTPAVRWTISDLEHLPDDDRTRYEIIGGELFMSKQPHWHHQRTCSHLHGRLFLWNLDNKLGEVVEAPGVIFSEEDAVAPDIVWVSNERLNVLLGDDGKLHGAPELVIEVLSFSTTNVERDKEFKRKLYSVRGVNEYWIVNWQLQTIEIYRRQAAALQLVATLQGEDELTSPLLPNFKLNIAQVFE